MKSIMKSARFHEIRYKIHQISWNPLQNLLDFMKSIMKPARFHEIHYEIHKISCQILKNANLKM